jgi:hypothetical protein
VTSSGRISNVTDVSIEDWRRYATEYLEFWCSTDRQLVRDFSSEITCAKLADLFSPKKYKVARTVPGNGPEKYKPLVQKLNSLRDKEATRESVPAMVEKLCHDMSVVYGNFLPSAISKALWMMKGHPVVVYDRFAKGGLRNIGYVFGGLYQPYFDSWFTFFDKAETQAILEDVIAWIPKSSGAQKLIAMRKIGDGELKDLVGSPRFRNRVVDIWLMYQARP